VATKRDAGISGPLAARNAAGAVAAAARELRPVEIVGIYEMQREAAEGELAVLRQEVSGWFDGGGGLLRWALLPIRNQSIQMGMFGIFGPSLQGLSKPWCVVPADLVAHNCPLLMSKPTTHYQPSKTYPQTRTLAAQLRDAQNLVMVKERAAMAAERKAAALAAAGGGAEAGGGWALREQRQAAEVQRELCRCVCSFALGWG